MEGLDYLSLFLAMLTGAATVYCAIKQWAGWAAYYFFLAALNLFFALT
jgi:hypothetical protein